MNRGSEQKRHVRPGEAEERTPDEPRRPAESALAEDAFGSTEAGRSIERLVQAVERHQIELEQQNEELRAVQIELAESRDRYYELYDLAPVGYLNLTHQSRIAGANLTAADLLGVKRDELLGQRLSSFALPRHADALQAHLREVLRSGKKQGCDLTLGTKEGRPIPVHIESVAFADATGQRSECRSVLVDLSELRLAEEENARLTAQLHQATKMEAVGTLASGVAHDFNNLLMGLGGCADMALSRLPPNSPAIACLEEIKKAVDSGSTISRQLLTFSRKRNVESTVFELNDVVTGARNMLERLLGEDIDVMVRLQADDSRIRSDLAQVEQVLMNLAVNARDAMPRGGRLVIETRRVSLGKPNEPLLPAGDYVVLTVSDSGRGMTEETQQRIFEPFFTTKEVGKGTGLGLSMVHGIVEQAGGHIQVKSRPNEGTRFEISLPNAQEPVTRAHSLPASGAEEPFGAATVLLVEDERTVRMATRFYLERGGYRVIEADGGPAAIELCRDHSGQIDLLLTDVVLPGMGGAEIARVIRELRPGTKVIYMSAHPAEWLVSRGRIEEGVRTIQKPFGAELLLSRVRKVLGGTSGERDRVRSRLVSRPSATERLKDVRTEGRATVLIVDDDRVVRSALCHLLRSMGYQILEAEDGAAAVAVARGHDGAIDVLLADVRLPGKPVREVAEELLALHPGIGTILMSGSPRNAAIHEGLIDDTGIFAQKPVSVSELRRMIEGLLGNVGQRSSA
jgi:PAS domain S-box-containing protein